jgi:hypothetical protein
MPGIARIKIKRRPKYLNTKTKLDGYTFDSLKEQRRYLELLMMQKAGEIRDLEVHPKFRLEVEGQKVCTYTADFSYTDLDGNLIVEDVKSEPTKTPSYRIKKKLMRAVHGIEIREVGGGDRWKQKKQ